MLNSPVLAVDMEELHGPAANHMFISTPALSRHACL